MAIVWRGLGIIVPIIFFVVSWIISFFFDGTKTKILEADFLSWTALISGLLIALIGLGLKAQPTEEEEKYMPNADRKPKSKHDFFFIPVLYWGIGLIGLSIYLFFSIKTPSTDTSDYETIEIVSSPSTRIVNFYNPSLDTLIYIVADDSNEGLIERKKVAPGSYNTLELESRSYLFSAFNLDFVTTLSLPAKKYASDKSKYVRIKDDDGDFYQRKLNAMTTNKDDYDEAWLVLDGTHNLALVDISDICNKHTDIDDIKDIKWSREIYETYDAQDLIEPLYEKSNRNKKVTVLYPGKRIPKRIKEKEKIYILIPFVGDSIEDSLIIESIIEKF